MTKDNQVCLVSTTTHGYLYTVYAKDDLNRKKMIYTGEISENPKDCYCECKGWVILEKCYHQTIAKKIMEIKI